MGPAAGPTWTNAEAAQPGGNAAAPTTGAAVTPNPPGATVNHQRANTYDLRGNRTQVAGPGWNQVMQYDPEDRLFFEQRNGLPIQYTWENRGSLATKNAAGQLTTYENDYLGRMIGYQTATAHVRDTYAPTGQRVAHIDQLGVAPEEWYLPDGLETLADYTKQGANPEQFDGIYAAAGLDGKAARVNAAGQATYFFQDALGSVGQVIDQAGAVVRTNFTDAWGAPLAVGLPAPPVGLAGRWGYTGRERDDVSGLMHYRARTYDPATGRFTGRDPVRSFNLYTYVGNRPTGARDPLGEDILTDDRGVAGLIDRYGKEHIEVRDATAEELRARGPDRVGNKVVRLKQGRLKPGRTAGVEMEPGLFEEDVLDALVPAGETASGQSNRWLEKEREKYREGFRQEIRRLSDPHLFDERRSLSGIGPSRPPPPPDLRPPGERSVWKRLNTPTGRGGVISAHCPFDPDGMTPLEVVSAVIGVGASYGATAGLKVRTPHIKVDGRLVTGPVKALVAGRGPLTGISESDLAAARSVYWAAYWNAMATGHTDRAQYQLARIGATYGGAPPGSFTGDRP